MTNLQVVSSITHDEYPLWEMRRTHVIPWDIRFQYAYFLRDSAEPRVNIRPIDSVWFTMLCDLWVRALFTKRGYMLQLIHSDKYSDELVNRIADTFDKIVSEVVDRP